MTNFITKGQIVNILGFVGHRISLKLFKLCHYSKKDDTDKM